MGELEGAEPASNGIEFPQPLLCKESSGGRSEDASGRIGWKRIGILPVRKEKNEAISPGAPAEW